MDIAVNFGDILRKTCPAACGRNTAREVSVSLFYFTLLMKADG